MEKTKTNTLVVVFITAIVSVFLVLLVQNFTKGDQLIGKLNLPIKNNLERTMGECMKKDNGGKPFVCVCDWKGCFQYTCYEGDCRNT